MALAPGTLLGSYEVLSPLRLSGGVEIYRGRDARLGREVAIRLLPHPLDPGGLRRFQQEAGAASALDHPNISATLDIGSYAGLPYVVSELVEGQTLREHLATGPLPVLRALDHAAQMARGLAAAHEKGIVHGHLRPETVFVGTDGRVRLLDFGLATPAASARRADADAVTADHSPLAPPAGPVALIGYLSPEQARGEAAEAPSDIFALGAVLFEMVAGRPAFARSSALESLNAILKADVPELPGDVPPAVPRIVQACLEKDPHQRYRSAHDLAFALEMVTERASGRGPLMPAPRPPAWVALALLALMVGGAFGAGRWGRGAASAPQFRRLTAQRGTVTAARFAPDGQSAIYSARWGGSPSALFLTTLGGRETTTMAGPEAQLLAVSRTGELAMKLKAASPGLPGTLAQARPGEAPREVAPGITWTDWAPDGRLCLVRQAAGGFEQLEMPPGQILYKTRGVIRSPRVSPRGDLVAFWFRDESSPGELAVVDRGGHKQPLLQGQASGWAWHPGGHEVWLTSKDDAGATALLAVDLGGGQRRMAVVAGEATIEDVSSHGDALLSLFSESYETKYLPHGEGLERDISWPRGAVPAALSPDGASVLFTGFDLGSAPSVYLQGLATATPPSRLGPGSAVALAPDGRWALAIDPGGDDLVLLSVGPGEARKLSTAPVRPRPFAHFGPDGLRVVFMGDAPGSAGTFWVMDLTGGPPRPITPEAMQSRAALSPDGKWLFAGGRGGWGLFPVDGGDARVVPGAPAIEQRPLRWSADGRDVFMYELDDRAMAHVTRLDLAAGKVRPWRTLRPLDPSGVTGFADLLFTTPDGESYVHACVRTLGQLYLVTGLR